MKCVPNAYLTTQHAAYELLLNWQNGDPPTRGLGKDLGGGHRMTFRQEEQDNDGLNFKKKQSGQLGVRPKSLSGPKSPSQGSDNNSTKQTPCPAVWQLMDRHTSSHQYPGPSCLLNNGQ